MSLASRVQGWFTPPQQVLPPFLPVRAPARRAVARAAFVVACLVLGFVYGFVFAVFPPSFMVYMAIPVVMLALVVIWALPDQGRAPDRLLERLFFAYMVIIVLWPIYLAVQLPGLPWLSLRRLAAFPMALILLICLSVSARFRTELAAALNGMPGLWKMMAAFIVVQIVTIVPSRAPFGSLNIFLNNLVLWFGAFYAAAWVCARDGRAAKFGNYLIGMALVLGAMGLAEAYNEQILWARHIPSFLAVTDESVQRTLSGDFREGAYRVTGTYTVSLALAEYLALVTPFVLQKIAERPGLGAKLLYAGIDVLLLVIIILTRSRLGIVGWLAAHMVWGCIWAYRRWRSDKSDVLGPALAFAIPALALAFGVAMFTVDAIRFRTIGGGSTGFSDQARWEQLDGTWPLVLRNPIGYGTGQSGEVLGFRTPGGQVTVDTYIVTLLLDYGVIGFCLFLGIFGLAVATMLRISLRPRGREIDLAMPVCAALVAYLVVRLVFAQDDNAPLVYMMLGLASAIAYKAKVDSAAQPPA